MSTRLYVKAGKARLKARLKAKENDTVILEDPHTGETYPLPDFDKVARLFKLKIIRKRRA